MSIIWAFSFSLINTEPVQSLPPATLALGRLSLAALFFLPLFRWRRNAMTPYLALSLVAIGALQYGLMYIALFEAYPLLGEGHLVALFTLTTPVYVAALLGASEDVSLLRLSICALLAVAGAAILLWQSVDWSQAWRGFLVLQLSNVCFAVGQVAYRRLRLANPGLRDHSIYALLFVGAAITALAYAYLHDAIAPLASLRTDQLAVLLYLGAIASGISFFWWNKGAVLSRPATLAVMNNAKVPLAVAVALILFGESTPLLQLVCGGGLILWAALLAERRSA